MVEPVNVKTLPARAQLLHDVLVGTLHPEGPAILELRAAGISKARIDALYPFEFADAGAELLRTIQNWPSDQLRSQMAELSVTTTAFLTLLEDEAEGEATLWIANLENFQLSAAYKNLLADLKRERLSLSCTYAEILFDCWWVLSNWDRLSVPPAMRFANMHHSRLNKLLCALEGSAIANSAVLR